MRLRIREVLLASLPQRLLTDMAGAALRHPASRVCIPLFAKWYGVDLAEAEKPWRAYASLTEFFARRLARGSRKADADAAAIASPVDGRVAAAGEILADTLWQVKGMPYCARELLQDAAGDALTGGSYVTIYLAPGDYHRIHAPLAAVLRSVRHIGGTLFPVNPGGVRSVRKLFARNERVVSWFARDGGSFALVKVGSLLVGSVRLTLCETSAPPRRSRLPGGGTSRLAAPVAVAKGDELGWFEFGSTVILVFPPGAARIDVTAGQRLRALETIGRWLGGRGESR